MITVILLTKHSNKIIIPVEQCITWHSSGELLVVDSNQYRDSQPYSVQWVTNYGTFRPKCASHFLPSELRVLRERGGKRLISKAFPPTSALPLTSRDLTHHHRPLLWSFPENNLYMEHLRLGIRPSFPKSSFNISIQLNISTWTSLWNTWSIKSMWNSVHITL